jgi:hypothetical protein
MATATTPALEPIRREVSPQSAHELSETDSGAVTLHVFEGQAHDAAIPLTPAKIVELRADLAVMLLRVQPAIVATHVRSEAGRQAAELVRRAFVAPVELDKVSANDSDEIYRAIVAHVRSVRPYILREVG